MQENIYDNPFDDINANTIAPERILALWCTPFSTKSLIDTSEQYFCTQQLPIILEGSRGSGKTMILKYFSYYVLRERAIKSESKSILKQIEKDHCVGYYFRCDDSFVNTFKNIFENQAKEKWISFFEHYLELQFSNQLVMVLNDIRSSKSTDDNCNLDNLFEKYIRSNSNFINKNIQSINELQTYLSDELYYIDTFKNNSIFLDSVFRPKLMLELYSLSEDIVNFLKTTFTEFKDVMFLILVDEFENLTIEIQRFFNTKIKFTHKNISIRIGRRSEGIITTETINQSEYLRKGHDYFLFKINKDLDLKTQREYFCEIAEKRLSLSSQSASFNGKIKSIIELLGDKEDLDKECLEICKGKEDHLRFILSEKPMLSDDIDKRNTVINIIKNPKNPIAETINALWVIRSKDDPIKTAIRANRAMEDFFANKETEDSKKFHNDYDNKYRYSITVLLASLYKRKKLYYGFNAITHLSNGNTRTFINICRTIISDAIFYERENLLVNKKISIESQNRAISEFAVSEFDSICSIITYGNKIRNFILNVGNVFAEYHKDKKVRYPETNQFVFNGLELLPVEKKIIEMAESWSMIIKRERAQRVSAGINRKGDIYYINRAFCPIFGISYRVRGGVNVQFNNDEIKEMMVDLKTPKKLSMQGKAHLEKKNSLQISLFDDVEDDDE